MTDGHGWLRAPKVTLCLLVSYFLVDKALRSIGSHLIAGITGYKLGNARRVLSICVLLNIMIHFSVIIYFHLFSFFRQSTEKKRSLAKDDHSKRILRQRCTALYITVMLGAYLAYIFYFFDSVPWIIFDLANICCGVWMQLFFCSFIFFYGNFVIRLIQTSLGCRLLTWLSRWKRVKHLMFNPQTQVYFTLTFTLVLSIVQWIACDKVTVHETTFRLGLPHPLRVALITDIHSGASVYKQQVDRVVDRANDLDVDAIFIVGDVVDAPVDAIKDRVSSLAFLQSRLGTYMVTGNHEYYYGNWEEWASHFTAMGIHVLQNNVTNLDGLICLVGLNDLSSNKSGIDGHGMNVGAVDMCDGSRPIVVLEHNPAAAKIIANETSLMERSADSTPKKHVDLILSGHTHRGQFYVMLPYVYWFMPYAYGAYEVAPGTRLFVSAGTLYQTAPMKMVGMSQIWDITFT